MRGDLQDKGLKMLKHSLSSTGQRMKKKKRNNLLEIINQAIRKK